MKDVPRDLTGRMVYDKERGMGMIICYEPNTKQLLGWFEKNGHDGDLEQDGRPIPEEDQHGYWFYPDDPAFTILPRIGEKIEVWDTPCDSGKKHVVQEFRGYIAHWGYPIVSGNIREAITYWKNFSLIGSRNDIPDETTPTDTLCEVWDDNPKAKLKRYFKRMDNSGVPVFWTHGATSKTSSPDDQTYWKNYRIIEYPDGTKPGEE